MAGARIQQSACDPAGSKGAKLPFAAFARRPTLIYLSDAHCH